MISDRLCTSRSGFYVAEYRNMQCFFAVINIEFHSMLLSLRKVVVLEDQFTSPCPYPRSTSPCPWSTKSSKIVKDFTFCKQSVMYDYVKSINSVTATMHEVTVKNGLLTDVRYYLLIYVSK